MAKTSVKLTAKVYVCTFHVIPIKRYIDIKILTDTLTNIFTDTLPRILVDLLPKFSTDVRVAPKKD